MRFNGRKHGGAGVDGFSRNRGDATFQVFGSAGATVQTLRIFKIMLPCFILCFEDLHHFFLLSGDWQEVKCEFSTGVRLSIEAWINM